MVTRRITRFARVRARFAQVMSEFNIKGDLQVVYKKIARVHGGVLSEIRRRMTSGDVLMREPYHTQIQE